MCTILLAPLLLQPTPPYGDEQTIAVQVSVFAEFQPTPPHGDELI